MTKTVALLMALFVLSQSSLQSQLQSSSSLHVASQPPSPVNKVMDSCIKKGFNGVVLIADKGKITYLKYTGIANRHYDIPFSKDSRFHIFSVTKTFTAALIMQLVEQKKLSLDASISTYYPEYKGEAGSRATIRNLLTYSSGRDLQEMRSFLEIYSNDIWTVDTFITRYCSGKLVDTPGTKFNYNNGDYIILGKILEKIYGKSYETVLRENILIPFHMQHTDYLHHKDIIKGMAEAYSYDDSATSNKFYTPTNYYIDNLYSAGGMYSTAEDLLRFDQAIFNHTLLKKATVDTMRTASKELEGTAFGFWAYPKKFGSVNTLFAERQGGGYGNHSNWVHLIDKELTFILLANTDAVDLNSMRLRIISAYLGQ